MQFVRLSYLKAAVFRLDHEEVDNKEQCKAASTEDQAVEVIDALRNLRREERDEKVEKPAELKQVSEYQV